MNEIKNIYELEFTLGTIHSKNVVLVKCGVGKVNDEHMYYLCSRGLTEDQARGFITRGYLLPVLNYLLDENIKEKAANTLERRVVNA